MMGRLEMLRRLIEAALGIFAAAIVGAAFIALLFTALSGAASLLSFLRHV